MKDPGPCVSSPATSRINRVENSADCIIHRATKYPFPKRASDRRLVRTPEGLRTPPLAMRALLLLALLLVGSARIFAEGIEARGDHPREDERAAKRRAAEARGRQVSVDVVDDDGGLSVSRLDALQRWVEVSQTSSPRSSPRTPTARPVRSSPRRRMLRATGRARRGTGPPRSCGKRSAREGPCGRARRRRTSAWRYRWCSMSYGTARRAPGGCPRNGRARRWTSSTGRLAGGPYGTTGRQIQTPWTPACRFVCTR